MGTWGGAGTWGWAEHGVPGRRGAARKKPLACLQLGQGPPMLGAHAPGAEKSQGCQQGLAGSGWLSVGQLAPPSVFLACQPAHSPAPYNAVPYPTHRSWPPSCMATRNSRPAVRSVPSVATACPAGLPNSPPKTCGGAAGGADKLQEQGARPEGWPTDGRQAREPRRECCSHLGQAGPTLAQLKGGRLIQGLGRHTHHSALQGNKAPGDKAP